MYFCHYIVDEKNANNNVRGDEQQIYSAPQLKYFVFDGNKWDYICGGITAKTTSAFPRFSHL